MFIYSLIIFFTHTLIYTAEHDRGESSPAKRQALTAPDQTPPDLRTRLCDRNLKAYVKPSENEADPTVLWNLAIQYLKDFTRAPRASPPFRCSGLMNYSWFLALKEKLPSASLKKLARYGKVGISFAELIIHEGLIADPENYAQRLNIRIVNRRFVEIPCFLRQKPAPQTSVYIREVPTKSKKRIKVQVTTVE